MPNVWTPSQGTIQSPSPGSSEACFSNPVRRLALVSAMAACSASSRFLVTFLTRSFGNDRSVHFRPHTCGPAKKLVPLERSRVSYQEGVLQSNFFMRFVILLLAAIPLFAQTTGATFGTVIGLGGTPSDIVLDELRQRLYLVNSNANRVDVYSYASQRVVGSIPVGTNPLAAAMSMDSAYLYVTNNGSSTLSVIDLQLGIGQLQTNVSLPARPEGVAVGVDGRVLISTQGTGTNSLNNTLILFDRAQQSGQQVIPVQFPPPPVTPTVIQAVQARPTTTFRGKLERTPDGNFIIGVSTINNSQQTVLYVFEVVSGVLLRSRTVTGQSTTMSVSPDGGRFMAGFTLYDTASLTVIGQQSTTNAPFAMVGTFTTLTNVGGSAFAPDGGRLYSAFNTAPFANPTPRPQASTLLFSDSANLAITLGIKMPESIVAKMVITADGSNAWGLSESGLIYLPLSTVYDFPILQADTTTVFLAQDDCNRGIARAIVRVNNAGKGKLTFAVPSTLPGNSQAAVVIAATSGLAPSTVTFSMDPGRSGVVRTPGTNLYTGAGTNATGNALNVNLASVEAINIPNTIRVYMNFRQSDMRGVIYPIPTVPNANIEGVQDILLDEARERIYIANSGYNRIEVFDTKKLRFLAPIPAGQLPRQVALALDGTTLYVANAGGESITTIDLDQGVTTGRVDFPPIPRAGNAAVTAPQAMAYGLSGLQFLMSDGTQWKVIGNQAVPRVASSIVGQNAQGAQIPIAGPSRAMLASPDGSSIVVLGGTGLAYLYDGLSDAYTASRQLFTAPLTSYYGPLAAGPIRSYFLANGLITNTSLTVIGGSASPGTITFTPGFPGQPPTATVVSAGNRNVASVAPIDTKSFVRLTTPVRNNLASTTTDDRRTTLESLNVLTGEQSLIGIAPENPIQSAFGTTIQRVQPRQMVVDSTGTVYALTLSGLSVIPMTPTGEDTRPKVATGARAVVNSTDGTPNFKPGSFITISGTNLALPAVADQIPAPTVLGGSCVVFDDVALPLLQTSNGQISAQLPATIRTGINVVQVRSLATAQQSDPLVVTVQKP